LSQADAAWRHAQLRYNGMLENLRRAERDSINAEASRFADELRAGKDGIQTDNLSAARRRLYESVWGAVMEYNRTEREHTNAALLTGSWLPIASSPPGTETTTIPRERPSSWRQKPLRCNRVRLGDPIHELPSKRARTSQPLPLHGFLLHRAPDARGLLVRLIACCCTEHPGDHASRIGSKVQLSGLHSEGPDPVGLTDVDVRLKFLRAAVQLSVCQQRTTDASPSSRAASISE
jgi:hypothetical protein